MSSVRREPENGHSRSTAEKRLVLVMLAIALPMLAWIALTFGLPDSDPRSPGRYIAVFYGGLFGLLITIKTDDWKWQWGGALIGVGVGLAWLLLH
jgi:hypothetical protein